MPTVFLATAILFGLVLSGGIAAFAIRSSGRRYEQEQRHAAVSLLAQAAADAAIWRSLSPSEQTRANRNIARATTATRLLRTRGASTVAFWAEFYLNAFKRESSPAGTRLASHLREFATRLTNWANEPGREAHLFVSDVARQKSALGNTVEHTRVAQDEWLVPQHRLHATDNDPDASATPIPRPMSCAPCAIAPGQRRPLEAPKPSASRALGHRPSTWIPSPLRSLSSRRPGSLGPRC